MTKYKAQYGYAFIFSLLMFIFGCRSNISTLTEDEKVTQLFSEYFIDFIKTPPGVSWYHSDFRFTERYMNAIDYSGRHASQKKLQATLDGLQKLNHSALSTDNQHHADVLFYIAQLQLEALIEGYQEIHDMLPLCFYSGPANTLINTLDLKLNSKRAYEELFSRMDAFPGWVDKIILNLNKGIKKGITYPKPMVDRLIDQYTAVSQFNNGTHSLYYPIENLSKDLPSFDKAKITEGYLTRLETKVIPGFHKLAGFLKNNYKPYARESLSLYEIPKGKAFYNYLTRYYTTLDYSAQRIHDIGLKETKQTLTDIDQFKQQLSFDGTLVEFFQHLRNNPSHYDTHPPDTINNFHSLHRTVSESIHNLLPKSPETSINFAQTDHFKESTAPFTTYVWSEKEKEKSGTNTLYINTGLIKGQQNFLWDAIYLHEVMPGHHLQRSIALENTALPDFRKHYQCAAFDEGWAAYAESLGDQLSLYKSPAQKLGYLIKKLEYNAYLVVDTGIHHYGWDLTKVKQWYNDNTPFSDKQIDLFIRHITARPAHSLSYSIGEKKIRRLYNKSAKQLAESFDKRQFYQTLLSQGSEPLSLLSKRMSQWVNEQSRNHKTNHF